MNVSLFVIHDFDNEYFVRDCHFDFFFWQKLMNDKTTIQGYE